MSDVTPGGVMAGFWRWIGVSVFALAVAAAVVSASGRR